MASALCPTCGQPTPPGNRFCGSCGSPLAPSAPGPEAVPAVPSPIPVVGVDKERRLVTVLFADLVGSTTLGETLDPEEVLDLVSAAQAVLAETVTRYGGYVAKYLGDGLMALFGAPVAQEDDAERAVLAGLEMCAALVSTNDRRRTGTPPLQMRVGITSGEVIAGAIAGTYDVMGDAANTAARLQGEAEVGGVLVGEETVRLAQRRIRFGVRRVLSLKGKAEEVIAYPALGVRERVEERWETRQRTPFVGRESELKLIEAAWEHAQMGAGQLVTLVAEAGVGKSRLVAEALERIATSDVRILRARCLSYGQQISLSPISDLARNLCSTHEQDAHVHIRTQVDTTIGALLAAQDDGTRAVARDVLGELVGLSISSSLVAGASAEVRRQALIRTLRLLFRALTVQSPVALVVEDLHWIDGASAEVVTELLRGVPELQLLILATQRPGWTAPWLDWSWPIQLTVLPLNEQHSVQLAGAVLGGLALTPELEHYVTERAGGNPFFVEELLRSLQEAGDLVQEDGQIQLAEGAAERLPATLTEVLLARLDRLEHQVRGVAQIASVIGRSFALQLLARVLGQDPAALVSPLSVLERAEIAFPRRQSQAEYLFKHATIRDVAYNMLLQRRRQALHAAIAQAIIQLYPVDEYVETIAYHYSKTEDHWEAGKWLERAGDRAANIYANEAALAHYEEAQKRLEAAGVEPAVLAGLDEKIGGVLRTLGRYDQALEVLERAVVIHQRLGNETDVGRVVAQMGWVHANRGSPEHGVARIELLLDRLEQQGASPVLAALYAALGRLLFTCGRYSEALAIAARGSDLGRTLGDDRTVVTSELTRAMALSKLERTQEALAVLDAAIPQAEAVGDLDSLRIALISAAVMHWYGGRLDQSREQLERARTVAERSGNTVGVAFSLGMLGDLERYMGKWTRARELLERAVTMFRAIGAAWFSAYPLFQMGHLCLWEGRWEEAARHLEESRRIAQPSHDLQALRHGHAFQAEMDILQGHPEAAITRLQPVLDRPGLQEEDVSLYLWILAWAHLELGESAQAEAIVEESIDRASRQRLHIALPSALRVRGMVLTRQGRWEEAARDFRKSIALAQDMPFPYAVARTLYEYGRMHTQNGESQQARERLAEALAIFRRLGARPFIERTEQAMAEIHPPPSTASNSDQPSAGWERSSTKVEGGF